MTLVVAAAPVIPNFGGGAGQFACERANHLFCPNWVSRNWSPVLWPALRQHVELTLIAVAIGFVLSTALALTAYRRLWLERPVLIVTAILYTIPSLALFEVLQGVPGLGLSRTTAEVALVSYTLLIIFFSYFYTAIAFNPQQQADIIRKQGGFIPGIRPGPPTERYLAKVLNRITLPGSLFLATIAITPLLVFAFWDISQFPFGGTSLLITVGVALETMKQIDSQLMMRNYEGFLA